MRIWFHHLEKGKEILKINQRQNIEIVITKGRKVKILKKIHSKKNVQSRILFYNFMCIRELVLKCTCVCVEGVVAESRGQKEEKEEKQK